jgi:hypothetical protein
LQLTQFDVLSEPWEIASDGLVAKDIFVPSLKQAAYSELQDTQPSTGPAYTVEAMLNDSAAATPRVVIMVFMFSSSIHIIIIAH